VSTPTSISRPACPRTNSLGWRAAFRVRSPARKRLSLQLLLNREPRPPNPFMYNIRQFKPVLYLLLLLGMTGFALAAQAPGLWALGAAGVLLNAWLVGTGRFAPMPRLLANTVTLGATLYCARQMLTNIGPPVIVIGQFLVLLHLVKLWEQRANRDYAQLLVLSLLLMVAAAINTASLVFGVLFVAYL